MSVRILVVEDDMVIGSCIEKALTGVGYTVVRATTGEDAFFVATTQSFDLMVLDLCLGGRDGLAVLSALRASNKDLPVMILSGRCEVTDRVAGLQTGADDYLTKPFSMAELEARLEALLRRGRLEKSLKLNVGDLFMDVALRNVKRATRAIGLTALEFDMLELLMRRALSVVSRETLAREIWKEVNRVTPLDNVIDVHIGRIRKKVDLPGQNPLIHTVRGVGFLLSPRELQ